MEYLVGRSALFMHRFEIFKLIGVIDAPSENFFLKNALPSALMLIVLSTRVRGKVTVAACREH